MKLNDKDLIIHIDEMVHCCRVDIRLHKIKTCVIREETIIKLKNLYHENKWKIKKYVPDD